MKITLTLLCLISLNLFAKEISKPCISNFSTYSREAFKFISMPNTNGFDNLISDDEFTDIAYTLDDVLEFFEFFPANRFNWDEKCYIYLMSKKNKINVLVLLVKIQTESSLISDGLTNDYTRFYRMTWILGCDMYTSMISNGRYIKPYGGFYKQIERATWRLRGWYDEYYKGKKIVYINFDMKLRPANGATYALYKYTPFWGKTIENGAKCTGNENFVSLYQTYKKLWAKVKGT